MSASPDRPRISVVLLNYNGAPWLERCLGSIRAQTCFDQIELIVADNASPDHSGQLAEDLIRNWPNVHYLPFAENLGYCEGNNRAAAGARGKYLFFLNNDTWLEPECLARLLTEVKRAAAHAATPLVMDWDSDQPQWVFACGLDLFGLPSFARPRTQTWPLFMPPGCSYLIERELFVALGGFDRELYMYADELDLSWRIWISGHRSVAVPAARLHHRGAANVNPAGGERVAEFRTSDTKRFYANRNNLLVLLKNAQHVLLLLVPLQMLSLLAEATVGLILVRRWSFVRRAYLAAIADCWRLRRHIRSERRRLGPLRRRSDWWMLRFLRIRPNRWDELVRMWRLGRPKVSPGP